MIRIVRNMFRSMSHSAITRYCLVSGVVLLALQGFSLVAAETSFSFLDESATRGQGEWFVASNRNERIRLSSWLDEESQIVDETESTVDVSSSEIVPVSGIVPAANDDLGSTRFRVGSLTTSWRDTARRRTIPVKIFYPATARNETFPVIVFSHGLGGSYDRCSYLGRAWASRGFVTVLLQHPGSDENVWKGKIRILNELREAYQNNRSGRTRANDIRFVLNCLEQWAGGTSWIGSKLDMDRVGVGGYDLGALAALLVAGQTPPDRGPSLADSRVKAVLAMSPPIVGAPGGYRNTYAGIGIPAFFITGTEDDGLIGSTKAHQRRIPFDFMTGADRYLVVLQGADHMVYGGHILSFRAGNDQTFQSAIVRSSNCFWEATLTSRDRSMNALNGSGLNFLLGGLARIERRIIAPTEIEREEVVAQAVEATVEETVAGSETTAEQPVRPSTRNDESEEEKTTNFPLTRYYRSIVSKFETESSL